MKEKHIYFGNPKHLSVLLFILVPELTQIALKFSDSLVFCHSIALLKCPFMFWFTFCIFIELLPSFFPQILTILFVNRAPAMKP